MLPDEQELQDMKLKIGLMEKDIHQTNVLCERLSHSIEKIQELNQNLLQMIALHDQKHTQHEKVETELKEDIKEIHSRITTVNREIHERIDQVERHISERIDALRSDLANHKKNDEPRVTQILREMDRYKWMILGGAIVVGWILGNINLGVLGTLIK